MRNYQKKLTDSKGYSAIESLVVVTVLGVIIGGVVSLMQIGYWMNRQSQDGYDAQNEGRRVLSQMVGWLRPAQNIASNDVPLIYATADGTLIDAKIDTEKDGVPELARLVLDRDNERIVLYTDALDADLRYNYQSSTSTPGTYLTYYGTTVAETQLGDWDQERVIAEKIVNAPPSGSTWPAQTAATNPSEDFRLFTFYGDNFDVPLDTVAESNWRNFVRGVKLYIWSDIQPAEIPSPFGIQTNVSLRNIQGE